MQRECSAVPACDALAGRRPLYTGLYLPALSPEELAQAIAFARDAGASGAVLR